MFGAWLISGKDPEAPLATERGSLEYSANIDTMAMAADGSILATSDSSGMVQVWSPELGRRQSLLSRQHDHVRCVALTPDGASLAAGDMDATVSVWNTASGDLQWSVPVQRGELRTVGFSSDGTILAAGGSDRCVYLWDTATHRRKTRLSGHSNTVTALAFSPDARTLVSGSQDGTIRCWDPVVGQARWVAPTGTGIVSPTLLCLRYSPDGKRIAAAINNDPSVRSWDTETGRELPRLYGSAESMLSVEFTPDGTTLAAGDTRGCLTLWDLQSLRPWTSWQAHGSWIRSINISGDGRTLASAGEGGVKLWEISGEGKDRRTQ